MSFENSAPAGVRERIAAGQVAVIDVRTVEEFQEGHVPGSYNVPIAFKGMLGMTPNPDFLATMERHFAKDAQLVFV